MLLSRKKRGRTFGQEDEGLVGRYVKHDLLSSPTSSASPSPQPPPLTIHEYLYQRPPSHHTYEEPPLELDTETATSSQSPLIYSQPWLPHGWSTAVTKQGRRYYMDHNSQTTHWAHPYDRQYPPAGVYEQPPPPVRQVTPAAENTEEALPHWLRVYLVASPAHDDKLRWELFRLNELETFDALICRNQKQLTEKLVMRYEAERMALEREMEGRWAKMMQPEVLRRVALQQPETKV